MGRDLYNGWVVKSLERKCYCDFVHLKVNTFETDVITFYCYRCNLFFYDIYKFLGQGDGDFRTLREVIKKNMMNTKIVGFHYLCKERCLVFDIF